MKNKKELIIKSRIWICSNEGTFLGEGRIELLKKIDEFGSISKAAKDMRMSYKKAWELVNSINFQSELPIVTGRIGGKDGGGSVISDVGKRVIQKYDELNQKSIAFLQSEIKKIEWI